MKCRAKAKYILIQYSLAYPVSDGLDVRLILTALKNWRLQYFTLYTHSKFAIYKDISITGTEPLSFVSCKTSAQLLVDSVRY